MENKLGSNKIERTKKEKLVRVKRSSGEIDEGWSIVEAANGEIHIKKQDPSGKGTLNKVVGLYELLTINPEYTADYPPERQIKVKRSNGDIESDWSVGLLVGVERSGDRVFNACKGKYPPEDRTLFKQITESEIDELNS